jgi:hypothetical protein
MLLIGGGLALSANEARAPAAVVSKFNAAITGRDLQQALGYVGPGGVQFILRPSHTGLGVQQQGLSADLRAHWSMVGSVLFAATKSYVRKVEIIDTRVEDDVATVWTRTETETVRADGLGSRRDVFVELYVVLRADGQWKISAVADSRRPNDVGLGG